MKYFLRNGTEHKGRTHTHSDGTVMSGARMGKNSKKLFKFTQLSKTAQMKTQRGK
jgi:hypothetical protein